MSDIEREFHETWLGMVQPIEGLVVSIPVLLEKQCFERNPPALHYQLQALCSPANDNAAKADVPEDRRAVQDLPRFFEQLLGLTPDLWDAAAGYRKGITWAGVLPEVLRYYAPEGPQTIVPTLALRKQGDASTVSEADGEVAQAGTAYEMLVWELPREVSLDKAESVTGPWEYPPCAKFERLLRVSRVPIGLVINGHALRLIYAPHGEATGHIDFRIADMWTVGGRPILDALVMLLHANRFFSVAEERALPAILAESRKYQANVTNQLGEQVFDALTILLRGFERAAERDGRTLLDEALARENDHLYRGLLTVLLRIVFVLFAEDRDLLPTDKTLYADHYSLFALYDRLLADYGAFPDSMSRRFGAWGQLVALFRALYQGASHADLKMPARRGTLFNPNVFAFLEGWNPVGTAPIYEPELRAGVKLPTLDDETVFLVLQKLIVLDGQRLSYRSLDVEQIGSVYEGLMGFHVARVAGAAVRMRPDGVWLTGDEALEPPAARRAAFLTEHLNLPKAQAQKLAVTLHGTKKAEAAYEALQAYAMGRTKDLRADSCARPGQLVLQPGRERRRTSSHYTPRSLSSKVVERTLEPLLHCMTEKGALGPSSERILQLRVCDPAMGSGAFLVEACRYLGDALVSAWTREGQVGHYQDPVLAARRRVAQCCLYGVDKNAAAVELAKLSLWLVTLSKYRPFTFLDSNLRHGDSLVGLSLEQLRAFHWKPSGQRGFAELAIEQTLKEAIDCREKLRELAQGENGINPDPREKELLLRDANDALDRLRLIGDVCIGAFFSGDSDRAREQDRSRRRDLVERWLASDGTKSEKLEGELRAMQAALRASQTPFHWMLEFPDVFWDERADPLEGGAENKAAHLDAFIGNPPFMGGRMISSEFGNPYRDWLHSETVGAENVCDLSAYFFRRTASLLGKHGALGLVATNSISEGDTRLGGLRRLVCEQGMVIYDATCSLPWPGESAVTVSIVHLALGRIAAHATCRLDGMLVPAINSRLHSGPDREEAARLRNNASIVSQGSKIYGQGFLLEHVERDALIKQSGHNKSLIHPYLGGDEVNTSPTHTFERYVISFHGMELDECRKWPHLLQIVETRVRPEREGLKGDNSSADVLRRKWWRFQAHRPDLYAALGTMHRCLVNSQVSKHLVYAFQPTDRIFSHALNVFVLDGDTAFAILQSRIHETWARLLSSTMEDRLRYTASDCFETFPFPKTDPRTVIPKLERLGEQLYEVRAKYMRDTEQGLTKTYNALNDPTSTDRRIISLREQHEAIDAAVLAAYGWDTVKVPAFCAKTDKDKRDQEVFKGKVIDLLYKLNAERAHEEELTGLGGGKKSKAARSRVDNDNAEHPEPKQEKSRESKGPGPAKIRSSDKPTKKTSGGRK